MQNKLVKVWQGKGSNRSYSYGDWRIDIEQKSAYEMGKTKSYLDSIIYHMKEEGRDYHTGGIREAIKWIDSGKVRLWK